MLDGQEGLEPVSLFLGDRGHATINDLKEKEGECKLRHDGELAVGFPCCEFPSLLNLLRNSTSWNGTQFPRNGTTCTTTPPHVWLL